MFKCIDTSIHTRVRVSWYHIYTIFMQYSTRIEELTNSREAISAKPLGINLNFFTLLCTYRSSILHKVLERIREFHFFFTKIIFSSFLLILITKITHKKNSFICILVGHIYTKFIFCWRFSAYFLGHGTQNSKNTKSEISPQDFNKISWFLVW